MKNYINVTITGYRFTYPSEFFRAKKPYPLIVHKEKIEYIKDGAQYWQEELPCCWIKLKDQAELFSIQEPFSFVETFMHSDTETYKDAP